MSHPARADAVIFDLGGVLVDWSPYHLYRKLLPDDDAIAAFLEDIGLYAALLDLDTGERPFCEWTAGLMARHPRHGDLIAAYERRWHETIDGVFDDGVALVEALKRAGVPLYVLSNWGRETWQEAHRHHDLGFLELFDGAVISGEVGLVKPDPAIFALTCERFGLSPGRTAFIDDTAANTEAAAALGYHAIRHHGRSGTADLRRTLAGLGLPLT